MGWVFLMLQVGLNSEAQQSFHRKDFKEIRRTCWLRSSAQPTCFSSLLSWALRIPHRAELIVAFSTVFPVEDLSSLSVDVVARGSVSGSGFCGPADGLFTSCRLRRIRAPLPLSSTPLRQGQPEPSFQSIAAHLPGYDGVGREFEHDDLVSHPMANAPPLPLAYDGR